jgi:transposase-like protein
MRPTPRQDRALEPLLAALRDARFSRGLHCPHCCAAPTSSPADSRPPTIHRWGTFSGRQRYRCGACRRTFSDLTATPAAYAKKLALWPAYSRCMAQGWSVRRSAACVKIHPSTAFRWRHALLDRLRAVDAERLSGGWVELSTLRMPYSEKGQRTLDRPPRRCRERPDTAPFLGRQDVNVVIACDRLGRVIAAVAGISPVRRPTRLDLERALAGRVRGRVIVAARDGRFGAAGFFASRRGGTVHDARPGAHDRAGRLAHVDTAFAYGLRLETWLERFRGVATKYLPNYLAWHCAVDRTLRRGPAATILRWPMASTTNSRERRSRRGRQRGDRAARRPNSSREQDAEAAEE